MQARDDLAQRVSEALSDPGARTGTTEGARQGVNPRLHNCFRACHPDRRRMRRSCRKLLHRACGKGPGDWSLRSSEFQPRARQGGVGEAAFLGEIGQASKLSAGRRRKESRRDPGCGSPLQQPRPPRGANPGRPADPPLVRRGLQARSRHARARSVPAPARRAWAPA